MTPDDLVKIGAAEALKPYANLIDKLLGPLAEGIGEGFRALIGPWVLRNQIRFWKRSQEIIAEAGFEPRPVSPKLLLPIVQNASLEDDDSLQSNWARLLASAADPKRRNGIPMAFPDILRQLSALDAMFLEELYAKALDQAEKNPDSFEGRKTQRPLFYFVIGQRTQFFDLFNSMSRTRGIPFPNAGEFNIAVDNLKRLGIIGSDIDLREAMRVYENREPEMPNEEYRFTPLGVEFVEACLKPGRMAVIDESDPLKHELGTIQFRIISENVSNKLLVHLKTLKDFFIAHHDRMGLLKTNNEFFKEWLQHPFIGQAIADPSWTNEKIAKLREDIQRLSI